MNTNTETNELEIGEELFEQLAAMHRSIGNMFNVPLNMTIFDFSEKWLKVGLPERSTINLTTVDSIYTVARMSITPITSIIFDSEDEHLPSPCASEDTVDSYYHLDRPYTYGELLTVLYSANQKLFVLAKKYDAQGEPLVSAELFSIVEAFIYAWESLRPDTVKKMLSHDSMNVIAKAVALLNNTFSEINSEDDEAETECELDEDEE